jgi:hypothetical protein
LAVAEATHACLGIAVLGQCAYDPAKPTVYFSLGDAVAALAFTLTVAQLLRPIFRFRMRVRALSEGPVYVLVFAALALVVVASALPHLGAGDQAWAYPILWELVAAVLFALAYAAVVLAVVRPVKVTPRNVVRYVLNSGRFLAATDERDRIEYLRELAPSVPTLVDIAAFEEAQWQPSPFYDFTHRDELRRAGHARSLLMLLGDAMLCETMVSKAPWEAARMLQDLAAKQLHCRSAEPFVRELGRQALAAPESMVTRETGFYGFATAPLLSDSLFASPFLLHFYNPFDAIGWSGGLPSTPAALRRFNGAAKRALDTLVAHGMTGHEPAAYSIQHCLESVGLNLAIARQKGTLDRGFILPVLESVKLAIATADKILERMGEKQWGHLYVADAMDRRDDVLECLAETVFKALEHIANDFTGGDDPFWLVAIETFHEVFPSFGSGPDGMDPFQQRVAVKLINELQNNMRGYSPSISRVLLACVGSFSGHPNAPPKTAFNILKRAMYRELKQLPKLARSAGAEKVKPLLPDHVSFDLATSTLRDTFSDGSFVDTDLAKLRVRADALSSPKVRRKPHP